MGLGIILFKNLNFKGGAKWKGHTSFCSLRYLD
jgi:hypothetical protein